VILAVMLPFFFAQVDGDGDTVHISIDFSTLLSLHAGIGRNNFLIDWLTPTI